MKSKVKVAGTTYNIKGGNTKVSGTGYRIKKGKTKVSGTGYDIKFREYVDNTMYLYYLGDECTDITGGYTPYQIHDTYSYEVGSRTKEIDHLYMAGKGYQHGGFKTANSINFNGYSGMAICAKSYLNYPQNSLTGIRRDATNEPVRQFQAQYRFQGNKTYGAVNDNAGTVSRSIALLPNTATGSYYVYPQEWTWYLPDYEGIFWLYGLALYKTDDISYLSSYGSTEDEIVSNAASLLSNASAVKDLLFCTGSFMWKCISTPEFITAYEESINKQMIDDDPAWNKAMILARKGITAAKIGDYFTVTNGRYYFVGNGTTFRSNNSFEESSTAQTTLTAKEGMNVTIQYSYGTEEKFDKYTITFNGTNVLSSATGVGEGSFSGYLPAGRSIVFKYVKDGSNDYNGDFCEFSIII